MMRSLLIVALVAGTVHAEPDPFATARPTTAPTSEPEPAPLATDVKTRVVNEPQLVAYKDTFRRRKSQVVLGIVTMFAGVATCFLEMPYVGLPVIGLGFAVTVTAPLDRERTPISPTRPQVGLAFSGRF